MEIIILIAAILLIIFLGFKLKNIILVMVLAGIILFGALLALGVFIKAPLVALGSLIGGLALIFVIIFPFAYRQKKQDQERKEINDEWGREVWLKAEEERQKQKIKSGKS